MATSTRATGSEILDVAVLGSGPGGLGCALALSNQRPGCKVAVFEKATAFRPIGAALGLNELGYEALAELGIAKKVRERAANPQWHLLQRPNGEILYNDESMFSKTAFTWLGWYTLQTSLRESLPEGVNVYLQHRLVDFEQDEETGLVKLTFQVGSEETKTVYCRVLVGADGYHSVVRQKTVNDGAPIYTGTMTWRGVLDRNMFSFSSKTTLGKPFHSPDENGNLSIIGDGKNFWVMDCGNGQIAWTGTAPQESAQKSVSAHETALETFNDWPAVVERLIRATPAEDVVESGVYDREPVDSWGTLGGKFQRVTLLGDAAHPMRPSLGLGSTMAFQDALSLSKKLENVDFEDASAVAQALQEYEKERIQVTSPLQAKARVAGKESHDANQADRFKEMLDAHIASTRKKAVASDL